MYLNSITYRSLHPSIAGTSIQLLCQSYLTLVFFSTYRTVYDQTTIAFTVTEKSIAFLEHVVVTMTLNVTDYGREYSYDDIEELYPDIDAIYDLLEDDHPRRGDIKVELTSPHGTKSVLLPYRNNDYVNKEGYGNWPFMSVHFWGENPIGTWILTITYKSLFGHVEVGEFLSMTLYGTKTVPLSVQNIPPHCNSACARDCSGEGSENCDVCSNLRIASTLECVDSCPNGTHLYKKYCLSNVGNESKIDCSKEGGINALQAGLISLAVFILLVVVPIVIAVIIAVKYVTARKKKYQFRQLHMTPVETQIST